MTEIIPIDKRRKPLVDVALEYASRGIKVFAVTADGKAPANSNAAWARRLGRPVRKGEGGLNMATTDPETIRWMFSWKNAGAIGMPCGEVNGVIVLDLDIHKEPESGDGNARQCLRAYWDEIEECHQVETRNGGLHVYFAYEPGHRKKELGENIEVQSDGAYVLLPPSKGYRVKRLVQAEDWAAPCWEPQGPVVAAQQADDSSAEVPEHIKQMARLIREKKHWHDPVRDIVAYLVGCGWSDAEILRWTFQWTWPGYDARETFETLCVMIDGARAKGWGGQSK